MLLSVDIPEKKSLFSIFVQVANSIGAIKRTFRLSEMKFPPWKINSWQNSLRGGKMIHGINMREIPG
jgi:hypothetical protein